MAGRAGDGKTRVVLEGLRDPATSVRCLYLDDQARFEHAVLSHAKATKMSAILVVDECEDLDVLQRWSERLPSGCVLIGIGHAPSTLTTLALPGLANEPLAAMLRDRVPGLSDEESRRIVHHCGGSPKLVKFLADEKDTNWLALEKSRRLEEWLDKAYEMDTAERRVMHAISLFSRIGRDRPHDDELTILAGWLGLDRSVVSMHVDNLVTRKGILSPRGFSVYPTPDVLANVLARKALQHFESARIRDLVVRMPPRARESFAERLRQLGADEHTSGIEAELFGPKGLFRDAKALSDASIAAVARITAPAFPRLALMNYEALTSGLADEQMKALDGRSRRELVWSLETLAWLPETFSGAARILARLALHENESYANNATACFVALFRPELGATSAPYETRLPILEEMAHGSAAERRLAVAAIDVGLMLREGVRFGGPPSLPGRQIAEWHPPTGIVRGQILADLLRLLRGLLADSDEDVQASAAKALAENTWGFVFRGFAPEWSAAALTLAEATFPMRELVLESVRSLLHYHGKELSEAVRKTVDDTVAALAPRRLLERLRIETSRWPYETKETGEAFDALARDFLADSASWPDGIEWLLSGDAHSGWDFGSAVARYDASLEILHVMEQVEPILLRDERFLTGYLARIWDSGQAAFIEALLDRWARESRRVELAANMTHRLVPAPRGLTRLTTLFASGRLSASYLNRLTLGFYCRDAGPEDVILLVDSTASDQSEDACRGRLHVLQQYTSSTVTSSIVTDALRTAILDFITAEWNAMDEHVWSEGVGLCWAEGTFARAEVLFRAFLVKSKQRDFSSAGRLQSALGAAIQPLADAEKSKFLEVHLGPAFESEPVLGLSMVGRRGGSNILPLFPPEMLVDWITKDVEHRAWPIAHSVSLRGERMPPLARELLIRWGRRKDVSSALSAAFGTGSWTGKLSDYFQSRVDTLRAWEEDPAPPVSLFAKDLREHYEERVKHARKEEEDER